MLLAKLEVSVGTTRRDFFKTATFGVVAATVFGFDLQPPTLNSNN
jgi:hypothetical protein